MTRLRFHVLLILISALMLPGYTPADAASKAGQVTQSGQIDRRSVEITVYNSNLGLVREIRKVDLPAGTVALEFIDVASKIDATSVSFVADDVQVLEQNYEYDLVSPQKLMDKYVGKDVEIYEMETVKETPREKVTKAKLMSNNGGAVYLIDGNIHLGHPGRVVLPDLPANLRSRPTLVYTLDVGKQGPRDAEVTYQTTGMSWQCDYVAVVNKTDDRLPVLTGWVTLNNQSGGTYEDAKLKLIAGEVHRAEPASLRRYRDERSSGVLAMAEKRAPQFEEKGFFEYHLYTLQRPTTLKDNSSKQVELFSAYDVPVKKILAIETPRDQFYGWCYNQRGDEQKEKIKVMLELKNDKASHMGMPLPKGRARVNKEDDDGSLLFIGEDNIDHTPKDELIRLQMGEAFDVAATRRQTEFKIVRDDPREVEETFEIEIRNHKTTAIDVRVVEAWPQFQEIKLLNQSHPSIKRAAHTHEFTVPVKADGTEKLIYRVRIKF